MHGRNEEADWSMYCPAMYSGVAPMGTRESYTNRPTLDHLPMGSRFTPRLMSAAASSRRRHLSVFVRSVTGRCVSFASSSSIVSATLKVSKKYRTRNVLYP